MNLLKNISFSILSIVLFFCFCEIVLTAMDFRYSNTPLLIQRTIKYNNRDGIIRFKKDPVQFWVPVSSFESATPLKKTRQMRRIATLGDSCTQGCAVDTEEWTWSYPYAYPDFLGSYLKADMKRSGIEVLNAGVGSYSSFQGLKRLEHAVLKYDPDLITIYFGWNDHWLGNQEDKDLLPLNGFQVFFFNIMENFRFFQWIHYCVAKIKKITSTDRAGDKNVLKWRVPPLDYEKNLNSMIDLAQKNEAAVMLITAPHNLKNWEPWDIFPFPKEDLIQTHQRYNNIVRSTAKLRGVHLLDLEKIMQQQDLDVLMSRDGIHLTSEGCHFVAKTLAKKISEEKILPS